MKKYQVEAWDTLQHLFKVKKINNHILHFSAEFSGCLDIAVLKEAINTVIEAFPLIRCGYKERSYRRPLWYDMGHTADEMFSVIETSDPASEVSKFLGSETDLENGPQMKVGLIRSQNKDTLCILINHMLCDAAGFKEVLYLLSSAYRSLINKTAPSLTSQMTDRSIHQLVKACSLKEKWNIYFSKNSLNPHGEQQFDFQGDLSSPFIEMRKIPEHQFSQMKEYAKKKQVSINDIMLTAFQRTLFQTFGSCSALPCAIDLRRFMKDHKANGICNMISNICCQTSFRSGDCFETTLGQVKKEMDIQKTNPQSIRNVLLLEKIYHIFPYKIVWCAMRHNFENPPIAFTNIGILDEQKLSFGQSPVMQNAYMTGSIKYKPYFQISLSTFRQEAALCVNLYGTQEDRKQISDFLDALLSEAVHQSSES